MRDNGIGIEPQIGKRIIEVFQHFNQRDGHGGSGIGLAISRRIVERQWGTIVGRIGAWKRIGFSLRFPIKADCPSQD